MFRTSFRRLVAASLAVFTALYSCFGLFVFQASAAITTNAVNNLVAGNQTIKASSNALAVLGINAVASASETLSSVKVTINPQAGFVMSDLAALGTGASSGLALYIDNKSGGVTGSFDATDTAVTLSAAPTLVTSTQFSKLTPSATAVVTDTTISIAVGDVAFTNITAGGAPTNGYAWHMVTTAPASAGPADSALRLEGAGAAPTYVGSSRFSKLTPSATAAVSDSAMSIAVGDVAFASITAGGAPTTGYAWHMVTTATNGGVSGSALRLDGAGAAPTYAASSQFSKLAVSTGSFVIPASGAIPAPGSGYTTPAVGDIVLYQTGANAAVWGVVTNATLTTGTFAINGTALSASTTYQISKVTGYTPATAAVSDSALAITTGDLAIALVTNNPQTSLVGWHVATTGATGVAGTALRLDGAASAPMYGITATLTANAGQAVPANDTGVNAGNDFYIVAKTASSAVNGHAFSLGIAPGDITYSAGTPTTTPAAVASGAITIDTTTPAIDVSRTAPANGATNVPPFTFMGVFFNKGMDPTTFTPANVTLTNSTDSQSVAIGLRSMFDGFNVVVSSPPAYAASTNFSKLSGTSQATYQISGTNPIFPQPFSGYSNPGQGDIVLFQRDSFPGDVGLITNNTLTSGTFAVNGFNIAGNYQITKFSAASATGLVTASTSVNTGDIMVANTSANPTGIKYTWHMVTTGGVAVSSASLRLDGQSTLPTFVSGSSFSTITPAATGSFTVSGTSAISPSGSYSSPAVGDPVLYQTGATPPLWGIVTNATLTSGTFAINNTAVAAGTYQISKLMTPGAQGLSTDAATAFALGDVVLANTTANAANNGSYAFHSVSNGGTGLTNAALRLDNTSSPLVPSKQYALTVGTGVTDRAGNPLASATTITFSTGSTGTTDLTPPFVQSFSPQPGSQSLPPNANINVQFSVPMNVTGGASGTNSVLNPANVGLYTSSAGTVGTLVSATNTYNSSTNTVTIAPASTLTVNSDYVIKINATAQSANGASVPPMMTFFHTAAAADTAAPTVMGIYPSNAAIGITRNLNAVSAGFSKDMDPTTITATNITISPAVASTVGYNPAQRSAFLNLNAVLAINTTYTITVKSGATGVKDIAGNQLSADYTSTFTTVNAAADSTAPTVVHANADTFNVAVTFSKPMTVGGGPSAVDNIANYTLESPVGTQIALVGKTAAYDGPTMTAKISGLAMATGSTFKVTMANTVQDNGGNAISTSGSPAGNVAQGTVVNSSTTGGQLGPGGGPTQNPGMQGMNPVRATPQNRSAGGTSNYRIEMFASTSIPLGGTIVLTFPTGFDVTNAAAAVANTESFCNSDINGPAPGVVTIASVSSSVLARTVTVTTAGAATGTNSFLCFDLKNIVNSTVPSTVGYTLDIKTKDASGTILQSLTTSPFFLGGTAGSNTLTVVVFHDDNGNGVKDSGEQISGARVFLFSPAIGGLNTTTDGTGTATFSSLANGDYMLGIDPSTLGNFFAQSAPQPITITGNTTRNFILAGASSVLNITGNITGGPATTNVDVFGNSMTSGFTKTTVALNGSGAGSYSLPVQANTVYNVSVGPTIPSTFFAPGAPPPPPPTFNFMPPPPLRVNVLAANVSGQNFALTTTSKTITGTVVDSGGTGISNAGVFARPAAASTTAGSTAGFGTGAQTGTDGSFTLNVIPGIYAVGVFRPGMPMAKEQQITVPSSGSNTPATLTFVMGQSSSGLTITGTVVDTNNNPIPYSGVSARKVTSSSNTVPIGGGTENFVGGPTDANGAFTLYVSSGTWIVEAFAPGYGLLGTKTVTVGSASVSGQNFSAGNASIGTITGSATQASVTKQGVIVRAEGASGRNQSVTDASGNYTLKVPAGSYTITCVFPGVGDVALSGTVTVTSGGTTSGQNCAITSPLTITVNLTDGTNPITGAWVDVRDNNGRGNGTNVSTSSGANAVYTISVPPSAAGTSYTIRAGSPVYGQIGTTASVTASRTVTYTATAGTTFAVTGTVQAGGSPLSGAWVSLYGTPTGQTNIINVGAQTASDGTFSIQVPAGSYKIRADKPQYKSSTPATATVTAALAVGTVTLTTASKTISGTVTLNGTSVSNAYVDAVEAGGAIAVGQTDASGNYTLNVDNGSWTLNARSIGYQSGTTPAVSVAGTNISGQNITLNGISGYTVKPQRQETVTPTAGGLLTNTDIPNFKLNIPQGALSASDSNPATLSTQSNTSLPDAANATVLAKSGVTISASTSGGQLIKSLSQPVTVQIPENPNDLPAGASESNLVVGVYNSTTQQYDMLPTTVDTANHVLTTTVDHFSDFAPLVPSSSVTAPSSSSSSSSSSSGGGGGGGGGGGTYAPAPSTDTGTPSTTPSTAPSSSSPSTPVAAAPPSQPAPTPAVVGGSHASGTLVIDGKTVYLIKSGTRVAFRDSNEYKSYGYSFGQIVPASDADRSLPMGDISKAFDGTLALDTSDNRTIYMIGNGTKRGFTSMKVLRALGYNPANAVKINLSDYPAGDPIGSPNDAHPSGSLVSSKGTIYWVMNGQLLPFSSQAVFKSYGFAKTRVVKANASDLALPKGDLVKFRDGTLVKYQGNYYLISNGQKLPFSSKSALIKAGYKTKNVINADLKDYPSDTSQILA